MSHIDPISDEQLNALLDGELDNGERERIITEMSHNPELKARFEQLQRLKSMLRQAYQEVPQPTYPSHSHYTTPNYYGKAIAAAALLCIGIFIGWYAGTESALDAAGQIQAIGQFQGQMIEPSSNSESGQERILLHIGSNDEIRVEKVLQVAEELLQRSQQQHRKLRLEVVANSDGLSVLRKNSPYAKKIATLSKEYHNVRFLACGIAKKTASLKEARPIELLPEANDIPAALEEILERLQEGWTYVRG